jgi:hypothetical protein
MGDNNSWWVSCCLEKGKTSKPDFPSDAVVVIGVLCGLAVARVLSAILYGICPNDPRAFLGVALLLILVSVREQNSSTTNWKVERFLPGCTSSATSSHDGSDTSKTSSDSCFSPPSLDVRAFMRPLVGQSNADDMRDLLTGDANFVRYAEEPTRENIFCLRIDIPGLHQSSNLPISFEPAPL